MNPEYCRKWVFEPTYKKPRYVRPEPRKLFSIHSVKKVK